ncbi:hypothetical protein V490_02980 [Pseudogymnoascus sp. VKM F-3557]|nr:hypothetical protein V490_02980 [Pseudogymnoascus sp. VKM F-3557]
MNGNSTYLASVPGVCQKSVYSPVRPLAPNAYPPTNTPQATPPSSYACFSSLFSAAPSHNETFARCCGEAKPKIYGGDKPCNQYCEAANATAETAIYKCLHQANSGIGPFGCTGQQDGNGNFKSSAGPAKSLSVGGILVVGLAFLGMLNM